MSTSSYKVRGLAPGRRRAGSYPGTALLAAMVESHAPRLARFGVVGIIGVGVNTVVLYALVRAFGMNHVIAAGIGSEISIVGNFAMNDRWTFGDSVESGSWLTRLLRYNAVALGGMTISLGVLFVLTSFLGIHYLIANLIAIGCATLSNYALNSRFTWGMSAQVQELASVPIVAD